MRLVLLFYLYRKLLKEMIGFYKILEIYGSNWTFQVLKRWVMTVKKFIDFHYKRR
jgi:hypothetical protein